MDGSIVLETVEYGFIDFDERELDEPSTNDDEEAHVECRALNTNVGWAFESVKMK